MKITRENRRQQIDLSTQNPLFVKTENADSKLIAIFCGQIFGIKKMRRYIGTATSILPPLIT